MRETLSLYRPELRRHEGGYVNHPRDPGGATNIGITQRVYDAWRRKRGLAAQSVRQITDAEVDQIYDENYWSVVRGDDLPWGLDSATYDGAVNSGPRQGARWLQRAVGASADGAVGPQTIGAASAVSDKVAAIRDMCRRRMSFLRGLSHWEVFGTGWTRRVTQVEAWSVNLWLARGEGASQADIERHDHAAADEAQQSSTRNNRAGGAAAGAGAADGAAATVDAGGSTPEVPAGGQVPLPRPRPDLTTTGWETVDWVLLAVFLVAMGLAAFFLWRAYQQRARRDAYRLAATGVMSHGTDTGAGTDGGATTPADPPKSRNAKATGGGRAKSTSSRRRRS